MKTSQSQPEYRLCHLNKHTHAQLPNTTYLRTVFRNLFTLWFLWTLNRIERERVREREKKKKTASLTLSFAFCVTIQDDIRHETWWETCGEASSRLILPLLHSFLVSLLLATKVEALWSGAREEWTGLPCLIHRALKEGDHFLAAQRPTRKSAASMRSQSWFKEETSQLGLPAFKRNKAIVYNDNLRLLRKRHSQTNEEELRFWKKSRRRFQKDGLQLLARSNKVQSQMFRGCST